MVKLTNNSQSRSSKVKSEIFLTKSEQEVLDIALRTIRSLGFDRVRFYSLNEDRRFLVGKSHLGANDTFIGSRIPISAEFRSQPPPFDARPRVFKRDEEAEPAIFEVTPSEDDVKEFALIPMAPGGELTGIFIADNRQSKSTVDEEALGDLVPFISQAGAILVKRKLEEMERRTRKLDTVLQISTEVNSSLDVNLILHATCRSAVERLGVGHSGFVRFSPDLGSGQVYAEYPDLGALGQTLPLRDIPVWRDFIKSPKPLAVPDVKAAKSLGIGRDILLKNDICSILIVPVMSGDRLVGSFGLDSVGSLRDFTAEEIETCQIFADHVARAIEKAQLYEETRKRAAQVDDLWKSKQAIESRAPTDRDTLLTTITDQAVKLLGAVSGGIYEYMEDRAELRIITDSGSRQNIGKVLKVGEGMAGQLVLSRESYMSVKDYSSWEGRSRIFARARRRFGAVLEVPLNWEGRIIGILYIDDQAGRDFTRHEARLLALFADQAANTLVNADIIATDEENLKRLDKLSRATREVIAYVGKVMLDDLLTLIARHATDVLEAEVCSVFLVQQKGYMTLEASYGHREGAFRKGRRFDIVSGLGSGLMGHIACQGELFNLHGEELANHFAVRRTGANHTPSGECYSLLAVPLKKKVGNEEKLVGLLSLDNKKGRDKQSLPTLAFSVEDERILSIFAETVVLAIESSLFEEQLNKQQDNIDRLLNSSANGIIAADARGNVIRFNKRAEEILGYQSGDVLYKSVEDLYYDQGEARRIGRLMHLSRDGKITNYDTTVRNKAGQRVPIRLSATRLYDEHGSPLGSVGYFDRAIREIQSLLAQASEIIGSAQSPSEGLQKIAQMLLLLFSRSFCRILLRHDLNQPLVVRGAHYTPHAGGGQGWKSGMGRPLDESRWPGLDKVLKGCRPRVLSLNNKQNRPTLLRLSRSLGLDDIQSLLVVPLDIGGKNVALLEVGELRQDRPEFSPEEIGHISGIAAQTTILMSLYRDKKELEHLYGAAKAMTQAPNLKRVLKTVAERARDILGADSAAIWSYDGAQDRFISEEMVAVGIPADEVRRFREQEPQPGRTAYTVLDKGWIGVEDITNTKLTFIGRPTLRLLNRIRVRSFEGIALKVGGEPVGVLYVNYSAPRAFDAADRRALENFAAFAALSLRRARLHDQVERARTVAEDAAYATTLDDRGTRLETILQRAMNLLGCGAVVLYIYDQRNKKFQYPPKHKGLRHRGSVFRKKDIEHGSLVHKMLRRSTPYAVADISKDKDFSGMALTRVEKIVSSVALPLEALGEKVGVMFVNYREPHSFREDEIGNIKLVGVQAAVAISNARVYERAQKRGAVLQSLNRAGRDITGSLSLPRTLTRIAQQSLRIVKVTSGKKPAFSHVLVRSGVHLYRAATSYEQVKAKLDRKIEEIDLSRPGVPAGIAGRAVRTGEVQNVGDVKHDKDYVSLSRDIRSQLSVPLQISGRVVGVLTIEHPERDAFSLEDQESVELLATQAAVAIEHARRHKYSQSLYQAAQKIAKGLNLREVLETVAERARDILGADSAAIWSYDGAQDRFISEEMVAVGIPADEVRRFREQEPQPGRTAYTVLDKGWIGVGDLDSPKVAFLGDSARSFLKRIGVRSFEGIALKVGGEPVGVLYVNYSAPRAFDAADRRALENFAAFAALSLRRARLHDQVERARTVAEAVAWVTKLGRRDNTLDSCAWAALEILNCDSAMLYAYDPVARKLSYPPAHPGVNDDLVKHPEGVSYDSIVRKMLLRKSPKFVDNVETDRVFRHSRFAREAGVKSCVALPLEALGEKVGVMFANYHSPHRFTAEEVKSIQLFSLQVAVAVSNAQLYDQAQKRLEALHGIYEANREITRSLSIRSTLREIARQALQVIGPVREVKGCFSHVALKDDDGRLEFIWSSSQKILKILREDPKVTTGIAGRVLRRGIAANVGDVNKDEDYVPINPDSPRAEKIRSQLSVPLKLGRRVIGVLTIEHPGLYAFSSEDQKSVELLAAQAAVAIENAQQYEALEKAKGQVGSLTALAWMGMANNVWRHAIDQYAITTQVALRNLRDELQEIELGNSERERIEKRLNRIASQTEQMINEPITPVLADEAGTELIVINDYVEALMGQLERGGQLAGLTWRTKLMAENMTILCNRDWLGRAIDIIVNNSVKAMSSCAARRLTVTTHRADGAVEIAFTDTGRGIPLRIRRKLFREVIPRPYSKGMGIGLMLLQAIVQAYNGYVDVRASGAKGTTMVIGFPQTEAT